MIILGIETSCDETSASLVNDNKKILSNIILSQTQEHIDYGGVVPEIAARAHLNYIDKIIENSFKEAQLSINNIDAIAVTSGPGLIGGLIVGLMTAKGIASVAKKPLIGVNHLEGHALSVRLTNDIEFPYLLLLVSGGHCQFLTVYGPGKYKLLGTTIDDAVGEAFDKVGKMLNLPYPGGPKIEQRAKLGNESKFKFPTPLLNQNNCNFSFSGLKTAVKREIEKLELNDENIADICASFQKTVSEIICNKLEKAITLYNLEGNKIKNLAIAGGVAANNFIISNIKKAAAKKQFNLYFPPLKLCTDNGAMIAWAGIERMKCGLIDDIRIKPKARWPLEEL